MRHACHAIDRKIGHSCKLISYQHHVNLYCFIKNQQQHQDYDVQDQDFDVQDQDEKRTEI